MNIEIKDEILKKTLLDHINYECIENLYLNISIDVDIPYSKIKHIVTKEYIVNLIFNNLKFQNFLNKSILEIFTKDNEFSLYSDDILKYARIAIKEDPAYLEIKSKLNGIVKREIENLYKQELKQKEPNILKQAKALGYKLVKK